MFSIFEELFLLSLDDEKGSILSPTKKTISLGLSGAILSELALLGKIQTNEKGRLEVVDGSPTQDDVLDEALQTLTASDKLRKVTYWVTELSDKPKRFRERLGARLVEKNVLFEEEKHLFQPLPVREEEPQASPFKYELKNRLRAIILCNEEGDDRSLALLNLALASNLLNLIFTQDELRAAAKRIHTRMLRAALEKPALQTIEEIDLAVSYSLEDEAE